MTKRCSHTFDQSITISTSSLFTSACRMGSLVLPFVTQASDSIEEEEAEEPILKDHPPPPPASTLKLQHHPPPLPKVPKKPLFQSGLFGFKFLDTTKQITVRQFKKKSGSKVRSHSRKKHLAESSGSQHAGNPLPPSILRLLGCHIDADSAKTINSIMIQDKLHQCKARSSVLPKCSNK